MSLKSKIFSAAKKAQASKKERDKEKSIGQKAFSKFKNNKNNSSNNQ